MSARFTMRTSLSIPSLPSVLAFSFSPFSNALLQRSTNCCSTHALFRLLSPLTFVPGIVMTTRFDPNGSIRPPNRIFRAEAHTFPFSDLPVVSLLQYCATSSLLSSPSSPLIFRRTRSCLRSR
ncbi:hypothetical protein BDN70DRAFT_887187 [Pholiota conissans]|uniref:Uncharacterized protein n=1 Tax=Pholiota conissans TaxID=109636 RepID=A0A9P5YMY6_9AGAR|nr:hypothetical protein BDN70DRAFT_887187 [Pholiota conissans]